jgi:diguanylate cyclase
MVAPSAMSVGVASFDRKSDAFWAEVRDTDFLARMGGEEFVALLPGGEIADAHRFAGRARASLDVAGDPGLPRVTLSAGVTAAVAPSDLQSILTRADGALYAAKLRGRDRIVIRRLTPS